MADSQKNPNENRQELDEILGRISESPAQEPPATKEISETEKKSSPPPQPDVEAEGIEGLLEKISELDSQKTPVKEGFWKRIWKFLSGA